MSLLAYFEEKSDLVQFCDMKTLKNKSYTLRVKSFPKKPTDLYNKKNKKDTSANILDIISVVMEGLTILMTSSNDGVIRMYEFYNDIFRPVSKCSNPQPMSIQNWKKN